MVATARFELAPVRLLKPLPLPLGYAAWSFVQESNLPWVGLQSTSFRQNSNKGRCPLGIRTQPCDLLAAVHPYTLRAVEPRLRIELSLATYQVAVLAVVTSKAGTSCGNRTRVVGLKVPRPDH